MNNRSIAIRTSFFAAGMETVTSIISFAIGNYGYATLSTACALLCLAVGILGGKDPCNCTFSNIRTRFFKNRSLNTIIEDDLEPPKDHP